MKLSQYAYFSVTSVAIGADVITTRLGVSADKVRARGSHRLEPPIPIAHSWELHADGNGRLDDQLTGLVARLLPLQHRIQELVAEGHHCSLQIVRNFGEGEPESHPDTGELVVIPGQHQLLGWHLDRTIIGFLAATGIELDVDEYG